MKKDAVRINKCLADNNYCSRREADRLIEDGLVFINGKKAVLGDYVHPTDTVEVPEREQAPRVYYAYYKPLGVVTVGAQEGEREIADRAKFPHTVFPLGRLDKDSEGLIIMTNDGRITEKLLHPKSRHEKEYRVEVRRPITHVFLIGMREGQRIGRVDKIPNYKTRPTKIRRTSKLTFDIILTEGKNRQIRKMVGALGNSVASLKRFRILNITLGALKPGQWKEIKGRALVEFLGTLGITE
jgi:23S rRNA pseudouridine2604 synthase